MLPSGGTLRFASRVGWAKTYVKKAGLLVQPKRGLVQITPVGMDVLGEAPSRIDVGYLERFPAFVEFRTGGRDKETTAEEAAIDSAAAELTPDEIMDKAYQRSREALVDELLDRIKSASPAYFERVVVHLLIAMGYGGSTREAGQAVGKRT